MVSSCRYVRSVSVSITGCLPIEILQLCQSQSVNITWCLPVDRVDMCL